MSLSVSIKKKIGSFCLDVSFETENTVTGILGASGCGKSMTLKCIAGIETPDEGRIVLNGVTLFDKEGRINLPPQERKVGYLFQNYSLFPNMTVEQNVCCGLWRIRDKAKRKKRAQDMIDKMLLTGLEKRKPSQLSGGQQQRAALARILVNEPELLLLDEPFSALDEYLRVQLESEMKHLLREFGRDAVLVSHNRDEVYRLCGSLAVMDQGTIRGTRSVKEVFHNPITRQGAVLTGCKNIVEARKSGTYEVEVPGWGVRFRTEEKVEEHLTAIGIRAHAFDEKEKRNSYPIRFVEQIEEPFEITRKFCYLSADPKAPPIWHRAAKGSLTEELPSAIGISPEKIMLLYA